MSPNFIIVPNATVEYSSESVCVCMCAHVLATVCVHARVSASACACFARQLKNVFPYFDSGTI